MRKIKDKRFLKSLEISREIVETKLASMPAAEADSTRTAIHRIASAARRVD